jgi:hypothetical protein
MFFRRRRQPVLPVVELDQLLTVDDPAGYIARLDGSVVRALLLHLVKGQR